MFNIYTGSDYPAKFEAEEVCFPLSVNSNLVNEPVLADFFVFPVNYEKLFGYTAQDYIDRSYSLDEIEFLKEKLFEMIELAKSFQKKIIIFYYFDPIKKIDLPNAIVFRTSIKKGIKNNNEYAMPAYTKDIRKRKSIAANELWIDKKDKPTVGFRGQAAPVKLPLKLAIKREINNVLQVTGIQKQFNLHYNFGYLARRDAIVTFLNNSKIQTDITLTTLEQSWDPVNAVTPFVDNIINNQYNLCVSGHGNYSFRLYEVLSVGRIPIFINTDCVLPFEEFIDWKKHVVWIEEKDASKADQYLLDFHHEIHPDDFLQLQKNNRILWENYLSKQGFYQSIHQYFPLFQ